MCVFFCVCVQAEALRRADHPSKEFLPTVPDQGTEETQPYTPKREQAPKCGSNEEEKKTVIDRLKRRKLKV
jgi:hypothetical protein